MSSTTLHNHLAEHLSETGRLQTACLAAAVSLRANFQVIAAKLRSQEKGGLCRSRVLVLLMLCHQESCFTAEYDTVCIADNTTIKPSVCSLHSCKLQNRLLEIDEAKALTVLEPAVCQWLHALHEHTGSSCRPAACMQSGTSD